MDAFPVAPEKMQAFPLGALNLLVIVASSVAAQHGADSARRICVELAANNALWLYIANHLGNHLEGAGERLPTAEVAGFHAEAAREAPATRETPAVGASDHPVEPVATALDATPGEPAIESAQGGPPTRKAKTRRKPKANGTGR